MCLGALCRCVGCCDCVACTVCVAYVYGEGVDGDRKAGVGTWGGVVVVSAGCEYMGGSRGSGFVSAADDVL